MNRRAFTLVELMVSIAIALLLMVGVSTVFTATTSTISQGRAVADRNRIWQATSRVIDRDLASMASDSPALVIHNQVVPAHLNLADEASGVAKGNYRADRVLFFARGKFARQTGNDNGPLVGGLDCREAFIWYGHLAVPNLAPGAGTAQTNRDNYFASQWRLGRVVQLMAAPDASGYIYDRGTPPVGQQYWKVDASKPLSPFTKETQDSAASKTLPESRYDLAGVTIDQYRQILANYAPTDSDPQWWQRLTDYRFQADPVVARPLTPQGVAKSIPILIDGTSNFLVEYSGDWVTQQADGTVGALAPDGETDFTFVHGYKTPRWFGFPRSTDADPTTNEIVPMADFAGTKAIFEREYTASTYIVAWGPDTEGLVNKPRRLRLIMRLSDNRLADDKTAMIEADVP